MYLNGQDEKRMKKKKKKIKSTLIIYISVAVNRSSDRMIFLKREWN